MAYENRRQTLGAKSTKIAKSSKRPSTIKRLRKSFVDGRKKLKFSDGPIASKPGPMLKSVACTQEKTLIKFSFGSIDETTSIEVI